METKQLRVLCDEALRDKVPYVWLRPEQLDEILKHVMGTKSNTAQARGMELLQMNQSQVPLFAMLYSQHNGQRVGICMEVFLDSFINYAHFIEGLPLENGEGALPDAEEFFKSSHYYTQSSFIAIGEIKKLQAEVKRLQAKG